jgi:hypothetical protein
MCVRRWSFWTDTRRFWMSSRRHATARKGSSKSAAATTDRGQRMAAGLACRHREISRLSKCTLQAKTAVGVGFLVDTAVTRRRTSTLVFRETLRYEGQVCSISKSTSQRLHVVADARGMLKPLVLHEGLHVARIMIGVGKQQAGTIDRWIRSASHIRPDAEARFGP